MKSLKSRLVESFINENEAEETKKATEYIDDMVKIHGDQKSIHRAIVNNLVNAPNNKYKASNAYVEKVWAAFRDKFPS